MISAVDEHVDATRCGGIGDCQDNKRCLTHDLWMDLSKQIRDFLSEITLADMTAKMDVQETAARQKKRIDFMPRSHSH